MGHDQPPQADQEPYQAQDRVGVENRIYFFGSTFVFTLSFESKAIGPAAAGRPDAPITRFVRLRLEQRLLRSVGEVLGVELVLGLRKTQRTLHGP